MDFFSMVSQKLAFLINSIEWFIYTEHEDIYTLCSDLVIPDTQCFASSKDFFTPRSLIHLHLMHRFILHQFKTF